MIRTGKHYFFILLRSGEVRGTGTEILSVIFIYHGTTHTVNNYLRGISLLVDVIVVATSTVIDLGHGGGGGLTSTCLLLRAVAGKMTSCTALDALVGTEAFEFEGCEGLPAWSLSAARCWGL
jgi:hypothetical protein